MLLWRSILRHYKRRRLPAVLVNSIPKAGTNLLKNIITTIPNMMYSGDVSLSALKHDPVERLEFIKQGISRITTGCIYTGHIPYSEEIHSWCDKQGFKQLFLYRDPRDVTVSIYHYIMKDSSPRSSSYKLFSGFDSDHIRLMKCITGHGDGEIEYRMSPETIPSIKLTYEVYAPWLRQPNVLAIKYEDLIGSTRIKTLETILEFIGIPCTQDLLDRMITSGFDPKKSHTYRKGFAGSWRDEYTPEHLEVFKKIFNDQFLASWGYKY